MYEISSEKSLEWDLTREEYTERKKKAVDLAKITRYVGHHSIFLLCWEKIKENGNNNMPVR